MINDDWIIDDNLFLQDFDVFLLLIEYILTLNI